MRSLRAAGLAVLWSVLTVAAADVRTASACTTDADCGCDGSTICDGGSCAPAFTLPVFPVAEPGAGAYTTPTIAVVDHAGAFYTGCCDTRITAFTGEAGERGADAILCPAPPTFPDCLFASCLCGYSATDGSTFDVNGAYVGVIGPTHLQYDGHAGYDYQAGAGVPLVATRAGALCKAIADPVNGTNGQPTAWEGFHSFYVDHGTVAGAGWASWYLHATNLGGTALDGRSLASLVPGECAPVAEGQLVATAGNTGTFLPHLHFEVRRYVPLDGPEAFSAKVVDPYGWQGSTPDPWSVPGNNPQAATQGPSLWRGCGNGRIECGEPCDGDACCTATCEPAVPQTGCRTPITAGAASLALQITPPRLQWKWTRGAATSAADFGTPTTSTRYRVCAFADAGTPTPLFGATIPAGGTCSGTQAKPCWQSLGAPAGSRGHRYRDRVAAADGIESLTLKPGAAGKAQIVLKGRGAAFALPSFPLAVPVRVQLSADGGACWEARFTASGAQRHDGERFKGKSE